MGTQHQDVIEINGKKYDAVSGRLIDKNQTTNQITTMQPTVKRTNGVAVDGFVKSTHAIRKVQHQKKPLQKSQTLMRTAVKKPIATTKTPRPTTVAGISKPQLGSSAHRQKLAAETIKSPQISKFGSAEHRTSIVKKVQDLPVKQVVQHATHHETATLQAHHAVQAQPSASHLAPSRSKATSALIEKALTNATAHEQPLHSVEHGKKRRKIAHKLGISARAMAVSSSVLAGVLLGGFFALQNVPNLSMRVAAARAGFNASMPGYNPSGFSFKGPINYSPGQVTVSFSSNTDDRQYNVTQRASNWNSDALLSNFVAVDSNQYQTYLDRGRTLYIYDGSNATWVDNGIWYQIEGKSAMTTDQLVRIAASI